MVIIAVLFIIVILWAAYFLDSLNKSQHHIFEENNSALNFLQWINRVSNGKLILQSRFLEDNFYLEDFPRVSLLAEIIFINLLVVVAVLRKQKIKQYALKICISILCFLVLFEFLNSTLKLFVPG